MAEILKYRYNEVFISNLCDKIENEYSTFERKAFVKNIFNDAWDKKELKERMSHIAVCLYDSLPKDFVQAINILKPVSSHFSGFEPMFFPDYVDRYGHEHHAIAIDALDYFTRYSSSEFAVRPFIIKQPTKMMKQMLKWAGSDNYHVRRLASEGCRPRLPWAMALPDFKKDPALILPILEKLKNDESEYVRRSVANNLNDIAKDNPDIVIDVASSWLGKTENTDKLVKHACRTLLKKGNPQVMIMFGFLPPEHIQLCHYQLDAEVKVGERVHFSFDLKVDSSTKNQRPEKAVLGKLRVEFAIGFMKSNGKQARKVFKISEGVVERSEKSTKKSFSFVPINTRKYYIGRHDVAIIINGVELGSRSFLLMK